MNMNSEPGWTHALMVVPQPYFFVGNSAGRWLGILFCIKLALLLQLLHLRVNNSIHILFLLCFISLHCIPKTPSSAFYCPIFSLVFKFAIFILVLHIRFSSSKFPH